MKEDVTERKRLEEGLRQAHEMDAIGRLAGGVAHDLSDLLTAIQGGAAMLREGGLGQDQGNELLDQISQAAERAVRIWLPLLEGTVPARPPPTAARPRGGDETLLVVEDDLSVQRMAQRILEQAGYRVHVASSAAAALDIWAEQRGRIDLVLTDLVMPGMGGRELAERLRAENPSLRVVYTTGYFPDALGGAAAQRDLLEKPYGPEEILARIRACLDGG